MTGFDVLRHRNWTQAELIAEGFDYYTFRKRVITARELPGNEASLIIKTAWDTLVAKVGDMICFSPKGLVRQNLYDYEHWPVRNDYFDDLFSPWAEDNWEPTPVANHLMSLGCAPYTRRSGVWAKKLMHETWVQSAESPKPVAVPIGAWLCISSEGSAWGYPYSMNDGDFLLRYISSI